MKDGKMLIHFIGPLVKLTATSGHTDYYPLVEGLSLTILLKF